jgi:glucokinase
MNSGTGMLIGVDVGGSSMSAGLVTPGGEVLRVARTRTHRDGPGTALDDLVRVIDEILAHAAGHRIEVDGIGIGLPGIIDTEAGAMRKGIEQMPELAGLPLTEQIQQRGGVPVFLDNDVNAQALAEWMWGRGRGSALMVLLAMGSGLGGGVILDGRLLRGRNGHAGEFGHVSIKFDGPTCVCGSRGCLGAYAAGYGIANEAARRAAVQAGRPMPPDPQSSALASRDAEPVFRAATAGDDVARAVIEDACQALGVALGNLVNGLNPDVIVVTGGIVKSLASFERKILDSASRYSLPGALAGTRIHFVPGDKSLTVRGGAALVVYERARRMALR